MARGHRDGVRQRDRPDLGQGALRAAAAFGTGVYTTGIQVGSTSAAALAVPLAGWLYGWRGALIAISCVALLSLVAWVVLTWGEAPHTVPAVSVPRLPWRSGTAWLLVAIFGLMSSAYYGLNAWLPDAYTERGWRRAARDCCSR